MLRIALFASVDIRFDDRTLHLPGAKDRALLCYLVLKRHRSHPRTTLEGIFWADVMEESARHSLRTALWQLRSALEPTAELRGKVLKMVGRGVAFAPEVPYWLDVEEFERAIRGSVGDDVPVEVKIERLSAALALYRGELLEGMYYDWCQGEQERYRTIFLQAGRHLMDLYLTTRRYEDAVACGERLLVCDALQEGVHRRLMEAYFGLGDRPAAIRQFQRCAELLKCQLELEPMRETMELHDRIRNGTAIVATPPQNIRFPAGALVG